MAALQQNRRHIFWAALLLLSCVEVLVESWMLQGPPWTCSIEGLDNGLDIGISESRTMDRGGEDECKCMETSRRVLGQEHPSMLTSMNKLAFTMKSQNRNVEAIEHMAVCVHLRNRTLGTEHPHALSSAATLAEWQNIK
jgi:hypothetical protein